MLLLYGFPFIFLVDHTAFYVTLIQKCSVDIKDFFHYSLYVSKLDIFKKKKKPGPVFTVQLDAVQTVLPSS